MKSTKWRWTAYAMKRTSRGRGCHRTQRLAPMPFISASVSLQRLRLHHRFGELGNQNSGRKGCFNLHSSDDLYESSIFPFSFVALSVEFGSSSDQIFHKKHVKSTKWRWTAYAMKRISRRRGCHRTQRLAPMPFISASVSLQRLCDCTIDLESLEIKTAAGKAV